MAAARSAVGGLLELPLGAADGSAAVDDSKNLRGSVSASKVRCCRPRHRDGGVCRVGVAELHLLYQCQLPAVRTTLAVLGAEQEPTGFLHNLPRLGRQG